MFHHVFFKVYTYKLVDFRIFATYGHGLAVLILNIE